MRGLKSTISLADQLLLTLTYLRHYPTFAKLGKEFSILTLTRFITEARHLGVLPMNSKKELTLDSVVDVTEQPIERPKQQQHHYTPDRLSKSN